MPNIFVLAVALSVLITAAMAVFTISHHTVEKSLYLLPLSIVNLFFVFGNYLEIVAPTLEAAFYGVRVQYMGSPFLLPLLYLFYRDFYGKKRFTPLQHILLFAIPALSAASLQLFPLVRLQYGDIWFGADGLVSSVRHTDGIAYLLGIVLNYACVILSLRLIFKSVRSHRGAKRRQSIVLLTGWIFPLAANVSFLFFGGSGSYDFTPIAYVTAMASLLYAALTQNLLNVLPLARAQVMDELGDAFVVCDASFRFLDANRAAKQLFPELSAMTAGDSMEQAQGFQSQGELRLRQDGEERWYKVTTHPILQNTAGGGACIVFRDVTTETRLLENLRRQATVDALTGVYNRGAFFDLAWQTLLRNREQARDSALLMIDADHFKRVNDDYGHLCGDAVLKAIAQAAQARLRRNDLVGRYGGEEFAVLLENRSREEAVEAAETLRQTIGSMTVACQDKSIRVTVSIGVAHCKAGCCETPEELLNRADEALYLSKSGGRNRTSLYREKVTVV